ncbi:MAG TPA: squalene synthase HpnC [Mycobacteriales bacterium]|jgi:squalene synthase HpnC|nr:squalene synthase HpnC [Mycobacteriales bacterium]
MTAMPAVGAEGAGLTWLSARAGTIDAARARRENFPVASRLLPAAVRHDLLAAYGVARLIDDAADAAPGDRGAVLDLLEADLRLLAAGEPQLRPIRALLPSVRSRHLPVAPFLALIEAGRMDQQVTRYATFEELRGYCRLSAEPVGRLVLEIWGLADADRFALSDDVCTALQVAEHLQDVGEDLAVGRIYLPQDALARAGVSEQLLTAVAGLPAAAGEPSPTAADRQRVAALLAGVAGQARELLQAGPALTRLVPGRAKVAVAGFVAGGHAALDAVLAAGDRAVRDTPHPRRRRVLWHTARTLRGRS